MTALHGFNRDWSSEYLLVISKDIWFNHSIEKIYLDWVFPIACWNDNDMVYMEIITQRIKFKLGIVWSLHSPKWEIVTYNLSFTLCHHFSESWLRWSAGIAREFEDQFPLRGHDGPRSRHHYSREVGQLRVPAKRRSGQEVFHSLQTVWGAADKTSMESFNSDFQIFH